MSIRGIVQDFLTEFNLRDALLGGETPLIHDEAAIQQVYVSRISRELLRNQPQSYSETLGFVQGTSHEHFLFLDKERKLIGRYDGPTIWDYEKGKVTVDLITAISKIVDPSLVHSIVFVRHNEGEDTGPSWEEPGQTNGDWNYYEVTVYKSPKRATMTTLITEELQRRSNIQRRRSFQKS